jgi:hypothetical protein
MSRKATAHPIGKWSLTALGLALLSVALLSFESSPLGPSPAAAANITVETEVDNTDTNDNECSLREAVENANADNGAHNDCEAGTGNDRILFAADVTFIELESLLAITDSDFLTIEGGGDVTLDGGDTTQILQMNAGAGLLVVQNITIQNGFVDGVSDGGAINVIDGTLNILNSVLTSNRTNNANGGAIWNSGTVRIEDSRLSENDAEPARDGGAIAQSSGGQLTIIDTEIRGNEAGRRGGAIDNGGGNVTITGGSFVENRGGVGGAIYNDGGTVEVAGTLFDENEALGGVVDGNGGAIYSEQGSFTVIVRDSTFLDNVAVANGGAIANYDGSNLEVYTTTFVGNGACDEGGAIQNENAFATVENSTFDDNGALEGFAIYTHAEGEGDEATLDLLNVTIANSEFRPCQVQAPGVGPSTNVAMGALYVGVEPGGSNEATASHIIIANTVDPGVNCSSNEDELVSEGWNLSDDDSCTAFFNHPADLNGAAFDPLLEPLDDNGGPTETMALVPESPATDSGNNATCADEDQRGIERPQDGNDDGSEICDRGAFELEGEAAVEDEDDPTPTPTPTRTATRTPVPTSTPQPDRGSLGGPIGSLFDAAGAARDARASAATPVPPASAPPTASQAPAVVRPPSTGDAGLR